MRANVYESKSIIVKMYHLVRVVGVPQVVLEHGMHCTQQKYTKLEYTYTRRLMFDYIDLDHSYW